MNMKLLYKIFITSLFFVTGINTIISGNINQYQNNIVNIGLPFALLLTILVLLIKILSPPMIIFGNNITKNIGILSLIIFTLLATIFFHNPYTNPDQLTNFLKNLSIIGGLLLLF